MYFSLDFVIINTRKGTVIFVKQFLKIFSIILMVFAVAALIAGVIVHYSDSIQIAFRPKKKRYFHQSFSMRP